MGPHLKDRAYKLSITLVKSFWHMCCHMLNSGTIMIRVKEYLTLQLVMFIPTQLHILFTSNHSFGHHAKSVICTLPISLTLSIPSNRFHSYNLLTGSPLFIPSFMFPMPWLFRTFPPTISTSISCLVYKIQIHLFIN